MTRYRTHLRFLILITLVFFVVIVGNMITKASSTREADASSLPATVALQPSSIEKFKALPEPSPSLPPKPTTKPAIYAKSFIVIDGKTKYPLAAKDADTPVPIASTTKIMTALVALDTLELDEVGTVPREAAQIEGSEIHLLTGEKMTVENLLYATLVSSANDAANALARMHGTSEEFIAKMNAKAETLGLRNTHYYSVEGLDDRGHSTPRDLALLTSYALENPLFRKIVSTPQYTITSADGRYQHPLVSSDRLIRPEEALYYPAAIGVKTGFTYEAGHCLVAAADYGSSRHIAVVLNTTESTNDASAREARKLLVWAAPTN